MAITNTLPRRFCEITGWHRRDFWRSLGWGMLMMRLERFLMPARVVLRRLQKVRKARFPWNSTRISYFFVANWIPEEMIPWNRCSTSMYTRRMLISRQVLGYDLGIHKSKSPWCWIKSHGGKRRQELYVLEANGLKIWPRYWWASFHFKWGLTGKSWDKVSVSTWRHLANVIHVGLEVS